jgi:hypothetical protein
LDDAFGEALRQLRRTEPNGCGCEIDVARDDPDDATGPVMSQVLTMRRPVMGLIMPAAISDAELGCGSSITRQAMSALLKYQLKKLPHIP